MKKALMIIPILALGACASSSMTYGPDGRPAYTLNCSGTIRTWGMCLEKAGKLCGQAGYDVLQTSSDNGFTAGGGSGSFYAGSVMTRSMLIECKRPS